MSSAKTAKKMLGAETRAKIRTIKTDRLALYRPYSLQLHHSCTAVLQVIAHHIAAMPGSVKSDVSSLASPRRAKGATPKKTEGPLPPASTYVRVEYGDSRVEVYRNLKERDVTGRGDVFILEGENSVRNLVRNGRMPLVSVCLSERRLRPMASLIEALATHDVPVYVLKADAFSSIVGFNFHRGVLACGRRPKLLAPLEVASSLAREGHSTLILGETINNLDNVGGLFRNAAAFGCGAVLLDAKSCDPLYRKACRVSGGHALNVPFSRTGGVGDVIAAAKRTGHVVVALVTPPSSDRICDIDADIGPPVPLDAWRPGNRPERVAVLVGAEGPGLTEAAQRLADVRLTIPMHGSVDSVNVATACAIALHALAATPSVAARQRDRRHRRAALAALGGLAAVVAGALLQRRLR